MPIEELVFIQYEYVMCGGMSERRDVKSSSSVDALNLKSADKLFTKPRL